MDPHVVSVWAINLLFGLCGWLCIFKTKTLVDWNRKNFAKLSQAVPHPSTVFGRWYLNFIRLAGVFIWMWAALFDFVAYKGKFR